MEPLPANFTRRREVDSGAYPIRKSYKLLIYIEDIEPMESEYSDVPAIPWDVAVLPACSFTKIVFSSSRGGCTEWSDGTRNAGQFSNSSGSSTFFTIADPDMSWVTSGW